MSGKYDGLNADQLIAQLHVRDDTIDDIIARNKRLKAQNSALLAAFSSLCDALRVGAIKVKKARP